MTIVHLGCGWDYRPGAVNVDRYDLTAADLQADALRLPLAAGSVTGIEARHLVEHLGYAGTVYAMAEWWRVLKPGGAILVETPERPAACLAAAEPDAPAQALHWVFGLPWPGCGHRTLLGETELRTLAKRAGFDQIEITQPEAPQPSLRLVAVKADNAQAKLLARLRTGFVATGVVYPLTAPPHMAHLETICDQVAAAAEALPQDGTNACLATILGATARYDPRVTLVAVQILVGQGFVTAEAAEPYLSLAQSLEDEAFPSQLAVYLRRNPSPPGTQVYRLQRLADYVSLYLTARLHPGEVALHPIRERLEAIWATPAHAEGSPAPSPQDQAEGLATDGMITFFCAATIADLSHRETAQGVRAFARNNHESARQHFEAAIAYDADNILPRWNLARLTLVEGQRLEALEHYAALMELLPQAADALHAEMNAVTERETGYESFLRPVRMKGSM